MSAFQSTLLFLLLSVAAGSLCQSAYALQEISGRLHEIDLELVQVRGRLPLGGRP